jgi:hypothetical protein
MNKLIKILILLLNFKKKKTFSAIYRRKPIVTREKKSIALPPIKKMQSRAFSFLFSSLLQVSNMLVLIFANVQPFWKLNSEYFFLLYNGVNIF